MNIKRLLILAGTLCLGLIIIITMLWLLSSPQETARAASSWYVAPGGNDSDACNSTAAPCATISGAIGKAMSGDTIKVAQSVYTENITIDIPLTLEGGYEKDSWTRDIEINETIIDGSNSPTVWGDWDGSGIHMSSVITDSGQYKMWYHGSGLNELGFGLATSSDGISWTKYAGNPIVTPTEDWEEDSLGHPHVIKDGSSYKLWYGPNDQLVGYAWSNDGINWTKYANNPIMEGTPGSWDESGVGAPYVIKMGTDDYRMWYQGGSFSGIGYATSPNGIDWTKHPDPVLELGPEGSWESIGIADPNVVYDGANYHMWYTGWDEQAFYIGYAFSSDGVTWVKSLSNPILSRGAPSEWDEYGVAEPNVLVDGMDYRMWFTGIQNYWYSPQKGYATSSDGLDWNKYEGNPVVQVGTPGEWGQPVVSFNEDSGGSVLDGFTIRNGQAQNGGGVLMTGTGASIYNCSVINNSAHDAGGGINNRGSLTLTNSTVSYNTADRQGGGIQGTSGSSTVIIDSQILGNKAVNDQGGGISGDGGDIHLVSSWVVGNVAENNEGGGVSDDGSFYGENCIIAGNYAGTSAGGLWLYDINNLGGPFHLVNCTVVGNDAADEGGAFATRSSTQIEITNTLIISNGGNTGIADRDESGSVFLLDYCDTYGNSPDGTDGVTITRSNCLGTPQEDGLNPMMGGGALPGGVGPDYADEWLNYDYRLLAGSPAIDAGTPVGAPASDIEGNPRDDTPDIGAFENIYLHIYLPLATK